MSFISVTKRHMASGFTAPFKLLSTKVILQSNHGFAMTVVNSVKSVRQLHSPLTHLSGPKPTHEGIYFMTAARKLKKEMLLMLDFNL